MEEADRTAIHEVMEQQTVGGRAGMRAGGRRWGLWRRFGAAAGSGDGGAPFPPGALPYRAAAALGPTLALAPAPPATYP